MGSESRYIEVEGLSLKTPLGSAYYDVTFSADRGQVVCLFGTEGSGKTALMLSIAARMRHTSGEARVDGHDIAKEARAVRSLSALTVIERVNDVPANLKVRDILASELSLWGKKANKAAVASLLEEWDFLELAQVRYRELESYDKTLFGIILAMAAEPALLMVDDIQEGLTQHQSIKLMKLFANLASERGVTTLVGCSEYEVARYADGLVVLSEGAELQRRAVIEAKGAAYGLPILGTGNGVCCDLDRPAGSYQRGALR